MKSGPNGGIFLEKGCVGATIARTFWELLPLQRASCIYFETYEVDENYCLHFQSPAVSYFLLRLNSPKIQTF